MTWVLVMIILSSSGKAVTTHEFHTEAKCEKAKVLFVKHAKTDVGSIYGTAFCSEK